MDLIRDLNSRRDTLNFSSACNVFFCLNNLCSLSFSLHFIENNKKENKILTEINDKVDKDFKKINDNDIIEDYMKIKNYKENNINLQIKLDNLIELKKALIREELKIKYYKENNLNIDIKKKI